MDLDRHIVTVAGEEIDLTPTEFDLLRCLMQNPGYVFSRDELLEEAVGYTFEGLGRTLDSHIKNLRRKIDPDGHQYIQTVYGVGYRRRTSAPHFPSLLPH
jgi:two-component system alkaline phosphatase synthesis response regulator PhoP